MGVHEYCDAIVFGSGITVNTIIRDSLILFYTSGTISDCDMTADGILGKHSARLCARYAEQ